MSVVRLWESQREYAKLLAELGVSVGELCSVFGSSDNAMRTALNGLKASPGFRDLTGGCIRLPRMTRTEHDTVLMLAERQLRQHPMLTGAFDKLARLLTATYQTEADRPTTEVVFENNAAGALDRIADAYTALGEQLFKLVRELRSEHLENAIVSVLDDHLDDRVAKAVEAYFA